MYPVISEKEIEDILTDAKPTKEQIRKIISKSLDKRRLTLQETAALINANAMFTLAEYGD